MLTVLNVAYPFAPVGPDAVGGAEQVVCMLDRALVAAGHRSVVIAEDGSEVGGELLPLPVTPAAAPITLATQAAAHDAVRQAIGAALRSRPIDLVHLHGLDFLAYLPPPGPPVLVTLHLRHEWYPREALLPMRPDTWLHCVSTAQHWALLAHLGPRAAKILPPIANGVPVEALAASRHACRGYVLVLGRICAEKGQHAAIEAARMAGVPLLIAGQVFPYPEHTAYFEAEIRPRLGPGCRFLGPVGFARKCRLLAAARCLLLPTLVPETSSLVAMEALACGTPVIAFAACAVENIVEHGRTGFVVDDPAAMAAAIGRAGTIDRDACRRVARERFSATRSTEAYLALYRRLAAPPPNPPPQAGEGKGGGRQGHCGAALAG